MVEFPLQGFPPCAGAGLVHVRPFVLVPGPHVVLHFVMVDHGPQPPSTALIKDKYIY
jgi:hypothetical protein